MLSWIKSLFGFEKEIANAANEAAKEVLSEEIPETHVGKVTKVDLAIEQTRLKENLKKSTTKKTKKSTGTCNFSKLTKTQLLAEAKQRGVKANASMKKQDILDRLNAE